MNFILLLFDNVSDFNEHFGGVFMVAVFESDIGEGFFGAIFIEESFFPVIFFLAVFNLFLS